MAGAARPGGFNPHLPGKYIVTLVYVEIAQSPILIISLRFSTSGIPHRLGAKLLGATCWFWIFVSARRDGKVLLVSPRAALLLLPRRILISVLGTTGTTTPLGPLVHLPSNY